MNPNQVVAHNLRLAREWRSWTQEEAAVHLERHLGVRWSRATFSAAERSASEGTRSREFDATEIAAFAATFGLPPEWFFLLPDHVGELEMGHEKITPRQWLRWMFADERGRNYYVFRLGGLLSEHRAGYKQRVQDQVAPAVAAALAAEPLSKETEELSRMLYKTANHLQRVNEHALKVAMEQQEGGGTDGEN